MTALAELMGALAGVPLLAGARCKGMSERFDLDVRSDREAVDWAVFACQACPALRLCRSWLDSLPSGRRPSGVVAGRLVDPFAPEYARRVMAADSKHATACS